MGDGWRICTLIAQQLHTKCHHAAALEWLAPRAAQLALDFEELQR